MHFGASFDQADDAVSRAMMAVYRRWTTIRTNPFAWAARAAIRYYVNAKRREERRLRRYIAGGAAQPEAFEETEFNSWVDDEWVKHQLSRLTARQRAVMELILEGFTAVEIARLLGSTPEAIRQRLLQARARLRAGLMRPPYDDGGPQGGQP
jgi:RNA polymerase sigma factor (sigma-70 family)